MFLCVQRKRRFFTPTWEHPCVLNGEQSWWLSVPFFLYKFRKVQVMLSWISFQICIADSTFSGWFSHESWLYYFSNSWLCFHADFLFRGRWILIQWWLRCKWSADLKALLFLVQVYNVPLFGQRKSACFFQCTSFSKREQLQLVTKKNTSNSTKTEIEKSFGQNCLLSLAHCVCTVLVSSLLNFFARFIYFGFKPHFLFLFWAKIPI